jgi:hypothetical protein
MNKKISQEEFIIRAIAKHGNKYLYDKAIYAGAYGYMDIFCIICNKFYSQRAANHLKGAGCRICARKIIRQTTALSLEEFITKARIIHGHKYIYDYVQYINAQSLVNIICVPCNELFLQTPAVHLSGSGHKKCALITVHQNNIKSLEQFIIEAETIHKGKYDYSYIEKYTHCLEGHPIFCKKCKEIFWQTPASHLAEKGCPRCAIGKQISNNETHWLDMLNIPQEYRNKILFVDKRRFNVDGFDPDTDTIYEFYGDYWHGNPKVFDQNKIDRKTGKTYGELYAKTIARESALKTAGYTIISIWEKDWKELVRNEKRKAC